MLKRALLLTAVAGIIIICLLILPPALADSISLENRENFYINYSTYDDSSLPVSNTGYNLTSGDVLSVLWKGDNSSAPNPPCVYLLNDFQFHGWDYVRKYAFLDPASRGYLRKENAWEMNMSYTVTSTDTYHVIIDNTNWILSIYWPQILVISYQAVQNYPNSYYLTVKTDTAGAASISGEGWYLRGYNKILTAPSTVAVNSSFQYRFNYWDVDGASYGIGVNPITVQMNANHTATAHYTPHKLLEHNASFSIQTSTYDQGLLVGSVAGYSLTAGNVLHLSWDGSVPKVYLLNDYQFHGWQFWRVQVFQDPATRGYIQRIRQDTGTIDYSVTSSGTYYVIILNVLWTPDILPTSSYMNYYDAFLDLPASYYLSVRTDPIGVASISGEGWYAGGSNAVLTAPAQVAVSSSAQYVFDYWDVDSIGHGSGVNPITVGIAANHTATAHYILQYQVSFIQNGLDSSASGAIVAVNNVPKAFGDLPYTFWKNNGSVIVYSYNTIAPSSATTKQFVLKNVVGPTSPVTITGATTVTGNYCTQYQVNFSQTGLSSDATGTIVTVNGTSNTLTQLPYTLWADNGSSVTYSYSSIVPSSVSGKQFRLNTITGPSSPITVTGPTTITGNYVVQYQVTFSQTGLDSTATGTVVTVNSNTKTYGDLPYTTWFDSGSSVTYAYGSIVSSSVSGKQFKLSSVTGPSSPITVTGSASIIGNYKTQYYLTVKTDPVGIATVSGEGWYDQASSISLTAPSVQNFTFGNWDIDGISQGNGMNPITITMNSSHIATAHYVSSTPLTVHIQPTSATINLGQSVTFTSTVQGGTLPYAYQWYQDGNSLQGATSNGWIFTPSTAGIHYVYLQVTDFSNNTAQSETARIVVLTTVPVGGYSVSFDKQAFIKPLTINFVLVIGLALFLVVFKRKTGKRRD